MRRSLNPLFPVFLGKIPTRRLEDPFVHVWDRGIKGNRGKLNILCPECLTQRSIKTLTCWAHVTRLSSLVQLRNRNAGNAMPMRQRTHCILSGCALLSASVWSWTPCLFFQNDTCLVHSWTTHATETRVLSQHPIDQLQETDTGEVAHYRYYRIAQATEMWVSSLHPIDQHASNWQLRSGALQDHTCTEIWVSSQHPIDRCASNWHLRSVALQDHTCNRNFKVFPASNWPKCTSDRYRRNCVLWTAQAQSKQRLFHPSNIRHEMQHRFLEAQTWSKEIYIYIYTYAHPV